MEHGNLKATTDGHSNGQVLMLEGSTDYPASYGVKGRRDLELGRVRDIIALWYKRPIAPENPGSGHIYPRISFDQSTLQVDLGWVKFIRV
jgi:hypothetical protein